MKKILVLFIFSIMSIYVRAQNEEWTFVIDCGNSTMWVSTDYKVKDNGNYLIKRKNLFPQYDSYWIDEWEISSDLKYYRVLNITRYEKGEIKEYSEYKPDRFHPGGAGDWKEIKFKYSPQGDIDKAFIKIIQSKKK